MLLLFALKLPGQAPAAAAPPAAVENTPTITFKSGVSNVRVDIQAVEDNKLILDLRKEDFEVYDNGLRQEILYFDHGAGPLSLVLLFDVSGSMKKYVEQVALVARRALQYLKPRDRVAVMIFSRGSKVRLNFTDDQARVVQEIRDAINDDSLGSATEINVALHDAARYIDANAGDTGRRAVLILTDNLGLNYKLPDERVIQALWEADAVLNAIVVGKGDRPNAAKPGSNLNPDFTHPDVYKIAEQTGGEAVKSASANAVFAQMIERIRTRYSLQYRTPESAKGFRHIQAMLVPTLRLKYKDLHLRYRKGYYARP